MRAPDPSSPVEVASEGMPELMPPRAAGPAAARTAELTIVVPCFNEAANIGPLVAALDRALASVSWEVIFVDDDSPDHSWEVAKRLAVADGRVRCLRRIGRRGLSSAVIEGGLASASPFIAVMDGDLQHDEARLPAMLEAVRRGADIALASRFVVGGDASGLSAAWRHRLTATGIRLASRLLPVRLTDPMSGFFLLRRELFELVAPRLAGRGFKILLDVILSAPRRLRVVELPATFRPRMAGESKLDVLVLVQFVAMLADKATGGLLPMRFIAFAAVGAFGILIDLAVVAAARQAGLAFDTAQVVATLVAMVANFWLNNAITYRDGRLCGPALWRGLALFMLVCGVGAAANVGIAQSLYRSHSGWTPASAAGAAIGVVWNYAVSATLVWRSR